MRRSILLGKRPPGPAGLVLAVCAQAIDDMRHDRFYQDCIAFINSDWCQGLLDDLSLVFDMELSPDDLWQAAHLSEEFSMAEYERIISRGFAQGVAYVEQRIALCKSLKTAIGGRLSDAEMASAYRAAIVAAKAHAQKQRAELDAIEEVQ